ncbi:unnamed protein product [Medioppia subpectinata]|uniref:Uncharacterized protein n=1 Tax=Medioppia subpectinata TaxID=1979941 RepID=A0A7R9KZ30_9ACAR|nr:unnamed protein product [Medioppia subpectinata]CAG2111329.1 unnamed protein product [Medioppia subpectinata]
MGVYINYNQIMPTIRDFMGKVVLITGSSAGIGATTAIEFSRSGAQVVITGRKAANVTQVANECHKVSPKGLKALEVVADVTKEDDCRRLVDTTIKSFGKMDILVNNAGKGAHNSLYDSHLMDSYDEVMATNLRSVVYLTHLCAPHLEKTRGNIVNISSVVGLKPFLNRFLYCMSKVALDMFGKCLALELGPKGIRVNTINPGPVRTNFGIALGRSREQYDQFLDERAKSLPLRRVGDPIDIANAVLFLASDESSFVTGANLLSDGGDFTGKVVLITGSSAGIGATTAIEFSRSGAQVVITGRNVVNMTQVANECHKVSPNGLKSLEVVADVTKDDDCRRLVDTTIKTFEKLDILVNNGGKVVHNSIYDSHLMDSYDEVMATNLRSVVYLTHLCAPHLEKTRGNIVNISSVVGLKPFPNSFLFCMSKAALDMFGKCLALELGPKGIRVNTINPGPVRINFGKTLALGQTREQYDEFMDERAKSVPLGRVGDPIDIANAVLFLASDESSFVTGSNILSDGGSLNA